MSDDREPYVPRALDTAPIEVGAIGPPVPDDSAPQPPPASRGFDPRSDWFWPVVNLIGIAAVILVNWLANALPFNDQTTGEVLTKDPVWFQPAGWVFSIWGLIYGLLVIFAIAGLLPFLRLHPHLRRISPLLLVANLANIVWLFCWHWEAFTASMIVMIILLLSLAIIAILLHARRDDVPVSRWERWLIWPVFSIYLGWVSVATLANLMVWWDRTGWSGGPISLRMWTVILLVAGGVICYVMAVLVHDGWYPAVFAFAGVAIAIEQWDRSRLVSTVAGLMAVIEVLLVAMVILVLLDRKPAMPRMLRRQSASPDGNVPLAD
jgi:hypothetical protein